MLLLCAVFSILTVLCCFSPVHAQSDSRLLQIKAAFTYRFLLFTKWPEQTSPASDEVIRIGVVDNHVFAALFEKMSSNQGANKKKIVVQFLDDSATADDFRRCRLLYISASAADRSNKILQQVAGYPVLTVSDMDSFVEVGGMIHLTTQQNRIRFVINRSRANDVGISFNAQMLKLATTVIEVDNE